MTRETVDITVPAEHATTLLALSKAYEEHGTTLRHAMGRYGLEAQLTQLAEECSELAVSALHFRRGKTNSDALFLEIADVLIMCAQVAIEMDDIDLAHAIEAKMSRLASRLGGGK